jgi:uncharacterized protein
MELIGQDFRRARGEWLYSATNAQPVWLAIILMLAVLLLNILLQGAASLVIAPFMEGGATDPRALIKGAIVGMLPVAIVATATGYGLAHLKGGNPVVSSALHVPRLGVLGWAAVTAGFLVVMYALILVIVLVFGVDLAQYTPGANGESPETGSAGLVKEAMFDLANEPRLFWLAIPSVALGAPLVEEFLFRGPLFASLANTRIGQWGTVLLTSAAWSVMHMSEPLFSVALIFMMGLALGALLLRFGSLWVTLVCHGAWNLIFSLATLGSVGQP